MEKQVGQRLPEWMTTEQNSGITAAGHRRLHFIRRTMEYIAGIFLNELYSERYAAKPLLLQILDPRVKIIAFLAFLIFGGFAHSLTVLISLAAIPVLYACLSGVEVKLFVRRIWLTIPLLIFVFSLPGASSLFVKGEPILWILSPGIMGLKDGLYLSWNGIQTALRLALRTGTSLSFGFLLLLTTRWQKVMEAFGALHLPSVFLSVCNMAYRYIFVLSLSAVERMEARFLRTVGVLSVHDNRRFMGRSTANLFLKSHLLSEEIYEAMCCRGYTGKSIVRSRTKWSGRDWIFLTGCALILLLLFLGELVF